MADQARIDAWKLKTRYVYLIGPDGLDIRGNPDLDELIGWAMDAAIRHFPSGGDDIIGEATAHLLLKDQKAGTADVDGGGGIVSMQQVGQMRIEYARSGLRDSEGLPEGDHYWLDTKYGRNAMSLARSAGASGIMRSV